MIQFYEHIFSKGLVQPPTSNPFEDANFHLKSLDFPASHVTLLVFTNCASLSSKQAPTAWMEPNQFVNDLKKKTEPPNLSGQRDIVDEPF